MFTVLMLTPSPRAALLVVCVSVAALFATACEKVPLLAPTGSTITLTAATPVLSANASTQIVAQVLEAAGTPPHSGTHITFTTSIGTIQPSDAVTDVNGRAIVTFSAGSNNGTAIITASSGGATTGTNGALRIAVGTAAVGRIAMSANPSTIPANGGSSTITANVVDINGNPLVAAPVTFTSSAGSLTNGVVNTDSTGVAQTTLTTSVQATVTGTVGVQTSAPTGGGSSSSAGGNPPTGSTTGTASATTTVNVNPNPNVSINGPAGTITANSPVSFTLTVTPAANSTAPVRDVSINFGDGTPTISLGAVTGSALQVQHRFEDDGTFTVRVTVTDVLGGVTTGATIVVVQPEPPLSVMIGQSKATSGSNTIITFTATVLPSTATVSSYFWNFGDGNSATTSSPQVVHSYATALLPTTVTVTATTTTGQQAVGQTAATP